MLAKASLTSYRSISLACMLAFARALRDAGAGPVNMMVGSVPTLAQETMRARGVSPLRSPKAFVPTSTAAAPSTMPDALPAVTVPSD